MAKTLEDIFNEDEFGLLDIKPKISVVKTDGDRLIDSFSEINAFIDKNKREPSTDSLSEYGLYSRLKSIRSNENHKMTLKPYDRHNLLGVVDFSTPTLDDIIGADDSGLLDVDTEVDIHIFRKVPKQDERAKTDFIAQRKPMREKDFAKYDEMFQQVHRELREGKRKIVSFDVFEENLKPGHFYIADGIMLFLESARLKKKKKNLKSGDRERIDGRTVTIFENGTKSDLLFRSLGKAVQRNGYLITDTDYNVENELFGNMNLVNEQDVKSGWIYVLRSKSGNPEIARIKDLYKIGFSTTRVEERIKNASNEATYLFADVEIVDRYVCYNLNVHNFENLLHRVFGERCLNIDLRNKLGQRVTPREWFVLPYEVIDEAINLIISGSIVNYRYDGHQGKLVLK